MKLKFILILFYFFVVTCKNNKDSLTLSDWFNAYRILNNDAVTLSGRAMKGRLKSASIKVIPLSEKGKCEKNSENILGTSTTNEKGDYSVTYKRIGAPVCLFVMPETDGSSKMYDEFSKSDLDWTGDSYLVSVMKEPATMVRKKSGLGITPLTRFAVSRLSALADKNENSSSLSDLVTKSNKDISRRFGIRNSVFSIRTKSIFASTENIEDSPEISDVAFDFDNPNDTNAVIQKAILGGISVLANQTKDVSGYSTKDVDEVLEVFSLYIASDKNDGKDESGNILTIPGSDVPIGNNALSGTLNSAIGTYIQSGGAQEIGVSVSDINSNISLVDTIIDTSTTAPLDTTPPQVLSYSPANGATNVMPSTTISITFDEPIDTSSTSLNAQSTDGTCRGTIQVSADEFVNCAGLTVNSSSNPTITLTPISPLQGNSTYKIRVTTGLVDVAINPISLTTSNGFSTVDLIQPTVASVTSTTANGSYENAANINVRLNFNVPVVVTGNPRVLLNTAPPTYANYMSGSGTNILDFTYTVGTNENSADLDYAATSALELNGATMTNTNTLVNASLTLPAPGGAGSLGANKNIIIDNTPPIINFTSVSSSNFESVASPTIAVNLSKPFFLTTTVDYTVTSGTATGSGTDYTLANGTLTFNPSITSQNITLAIVGDTIDELNETIVITLSNPSNGTLGTNTGHTYTITDDDAPPSVAFTTTTSANAESVTAVNISVDLSSVSGQTVTVNYAVTGGTATGGGGDYSLSNGTLTFAPGVASQNIALSINNDALDEDDKTIILLLSSPTLATLGTNTTHTYTITDDDAPPTIQFVLASNSSTDEANANYTVQVDLSSISGKTISAVVTDSGGTATSGSDYTALGSPITLTFNPGELSKSITIPVIQDLFAEGNETILLSLGSYTNVTNGVNTTHTFTITDDDFSISLASTLDCNGNGKIDHYKLTFASSLTDSSFPGYNANSLGSPTGAWSVAGYANVRLHHGAALSGVCASETDTIDDAIIYLAFDEGAGLDTGAKPDLTTTTGLGLTGVSGTAAQIFTGTIAEADGAEPIVVSISPTNGSSTIPVTSFVATAVFSEAMNTGTFNGTNFTLTGIGGVAGTVGTTNSTTTTFTASVNLDYNQNHTINIASMTDVNGQIVIPFSSTFTTSQKNKIAGTIANGAAGVTVTLTVNGGGPNNFNGTTSYTTTNLLGIGDTYSALISAQPLGKVCALVSTASNPAGGIFSGTNDLTIDVNCVNGFVNGNGIVVNAPTALGFHLYQGNVSTLAGQPANGYLNGTGGSAQFSSPIGITFDGQNFYVIDSGNNYLRKITPGGAVTTIAGNGSMGNTDGILVASFNLPRGIATDGTYVYISEVNGHRIKKVLLSTGYVETIAGDNTTITPTGADANGIGTAARFNQPTGLAIENNILYIADRNNGKIKKLDLATMDVTVLASASPLNTPEQITIVGNYLYVANDGGNNIIRVDKGSGAMIVFAGDSANTAGFADAIGTSARFSNPMGITSDGGNLFVADYSNKLIRKIDIATQNVSTLAGNGIAGNSDSAGIAATLNSPVHITTDGKNLFTSNSHSIRKISENGLVAFFPLNGSANDYAGNSSGTITGATPTTGRFGEANGGYLFSGTSLDKIDIPHSSAIALGSGDFSISLWVNPDTTQNDTTFPDNELVSDWDGVGGYNYAIRYHNASGFANGYFGQGHILFARFDGSTAINCYSGAPIQTNQFHHIVAQKIGTKLKLYLDGKNVCTVTDSIGLVNKTAIKTIGYRSGGSNRFSGKIADVRFYNRALTEGEANELAQNASPGLVGTTYNTGATGLLVNFHMDNGSNNSNGAIPDLGLTGSTGGNTLGKDGSTNGSRYFDGSSHYITTTTPLGMPSAKAPRTICGWAKLDSFPAPSNWYAIATQGSAASYQAFGIGIWNNNPNIQVIIPTWTTDYFFNVQIALHTWNHICATYDGTNVTAFANGVQLGSPQAASTINTGTSLFRIGALIDGGASNKFKGNLDDIRVYNNALTATQIRQLATQVPSGLISRYDLNGNAQDASGFENNGAINGSISSVPDRFGAPNSAYSFNGVSGNHISANDDNFPMGNFPRTLCAWYRKRANGYISPVLYGDVSSTRMNSITLSSENQIIYGAFNFDTWVTNDSFKNNLWHHVCMVYDGTNDLIYINGRLMLNQANGNRDTLSSGEQLRIGSYSGDSGAYFNGDIDEVLIYNRPLNNQEVKAISGYNPMQVSSWNVNPASSSLGFHIEAESFGLLADNTPLSTNWIDNGGNNFTATRNGTPVFKVGPNGINGKPAVDFNGTNQFFDAGNTSLSFSGVSAFAVVQNKNNADTFYRPIVIKDGAACASNRFNMHRNVNSNNFYFETNASNITTTATLNENVILSGINNGTNISLSKNGNSPTNGTSTPVSGTSACPLQVGGRTADNTFFQGLISEVLVFKSPLSSGDQDIVECYLSSKYNLPLGHSCP